MGGVVMTDFIVARLFLASIVMAPSLVFLCLAWLWFHVGIAVIFTISVSVLAGWIAREMDIRAEEEHRIKNYRIEP